MTACVFCAIIAGERPASRVYEDEATLSFMDLRQARPGHVLVVPKRHIRTLDVLDMETAARLFQATVIVARAVRAAFAPDGLTVWQSNEVAGGQEVFHVHVHIQPRYLGDGLINIYPQGHPAPQERATLDQLAARIRGALASG